MYTSKINIKHNRSAEIHWGVHKETNDIIWIDDVEANGYACNCKCACCGSDLKACTEGMIRRHHFKHRGNNGCYYSDEIAEYLKAEKLLSSLSTIWIPPMAVHIGNRPQIIQPQIETSISNVFCSYDANHYPPLLIADVDGTPTRILFSFDGYYKHDDYLQFVNEAREQSWNCLEIMLSKESDSPVITQELLHKYISNVTCNKRWIFHSQLQVYTERLYRAASKLAPSCESYSRVVDNAYPCPLHKRESNGNFYAFESDCKECDFRLTLRAEHCYCLAEAYIKDVADFHTPDDLRRNQFLEQQQKNEAEIQRKREQNARLLKLTGLSTAKPAVDRQRDAILDEEEVYDAFAKHLCPYCQIRLSEFPGKRKTTWMCLAHECGFHVVLDNTTGEIRFVHNRGAAEE